jgi:hypothetical protein
MQRLKRGRFSQSTTMLAPNLVVNGVATMIAQIPNSTSFHLPGRRPITFLLRWKHSGRPNRRQLAIFVEIPKADRRKKVQYFNNTVLRNSQL